HRASRRLRGGGREPIGAHAADLGRAEEGAVFENVEMLRERRKRHVEGARQLAHGRGAGAEPAQYGAPRGIAQRAKDPVEVHVLVRHMPNHTATRYLGQCLSEWREPSARSRVSACDPRGARIAVGDSRKGTLVECATRRSLKLAVP